MGVTLKLCKQTHETMLDSCRGITTIAFEKSDLNYDESGRKRRKISKKPAQNITILNFLKRILE